MAEKYRYSEVIEMFYCYIPQTQLRFHVSVLLVQCDDNFDQLAASLRIGNGVQLLIKTCAIKDVQCLCGYNCSCVGARVCL